MLRRCLFVSNIEKGERGGYFSRSDRAEFALSKKGGNFNVSQQLLSRVVGSVEIAAGSSLGLFGASQQRRHGLPVT